MCQSCFDEQWYERDIFAYLATARMDRLGATRQAILDLPGAEVESTPGGVRLMVWASNWFHVQVDDDNYDCDVTIDNRIYDDDGPRIMTPDEQARAELAGELWNSLDEDERSLVVAALGGYRFPEMHP